MMYLVSIPYKPTVATSLEDLATVLGTTQHGAKMALAKGSHKGRKIREVTEDKLRQLHASAITNYLRTKAADPDTRKTPVTDAAFYIENVPGYDLVWSVHKASNFSVETLPSLDRKDPLKGYSVENLTWLTRKANLQKGRTEDRKNTKSLVWKIEGVNRKYKSREQAFRAYRNRNYHLLPKTEAPKISCETI